MDDFSDREMYEQAAANVVAFVAAADGFLRERGIDPSELYRWFGEHYASGWEPQKGDVGATAREIALNLTSGGLETSTSSDDGAVIVRARWTEQHDGSEWPVPVRPALERATPLLFEAAMRRTGMELTVTGSDAGLELRVAPAHP
jgi:hypothetical protein